ncbi:hypothetical protein L249_5647 [Ophiocordyceps polyrhachis-furcata BCC 54312]|uniref:Uncharacterized protein n=1 Tax=Ophiocordyceps polyrhachis-furcata BCC 54312 TaxID=1330021 RepID=A0A367LGW7_9HYPO|nr:hypothetical protein L249_5647 [Ophiocordyceps polyrhachis-furcata BCC 54312]
MPCLSYSKKGSLTYPTFLPSRAVAASYVVVPFLPLLCDVRRPRAGYGRPGITRAVAASYVVVPFLPLRAVAASYVVVPFLPLLCNVRRPRAGYGRPGITI